MPEALQKQELIKCTNGSAFKNVPQELNQTTDLANCRWHCREFYTLFQELFKSIRLRNAMTFDLALIHHQKQGEKFSFYI